MPRAAEDLSGRTFGSWTVLRRDPEVRKSGDARWVCRCACGAELVIPRSNLTRGLTKQCASCRSDQRRAPKSRLVTPGRGLVRGIRTRGQG